MERLGIGLLALCLGIGLIVLAVLTLRAGRRRRTARRAYFSGCASLFESPVTALTPVGFPRLNGRYRGSLFDLQAVPDTLTFRKLPALWVMVSLPAPMPVAATLDILSRPSGQEPFTHFATLPQMLPTPVFLPASLAVRSDDSGGVPSQALLAAHAGLFADPNVKELLISPKGLRIVILAEEADRGRFLIFRDAEMGMSPLSPARVAPLLDRLAALRADLHDWSKEVR